MTTYTNHDPALPIEDLTPTQDQSAEANPAGATIEVDDVDTLVKLLTGWHSRKVKVLEHLLKLEGGIEMQVGDDEPIKLEGDVLKGMKAGVQLALMELGKLPFAVEYEQEAAANDAAAA